MLYTKIKLTDFPKWYKDYANKPFETYLNLDIDDNQIIIGVSENKQFNNINYGTVTDVGHCGGTIVGFPENITLFAFTNYNNNPHWENYLVDYLNNKGLNAEIKDNDVLIDGFKVAGFMSKWINSEIHFFGIHISINADENVIRQICTKEMIKIPKGLSYYGIKREDILNALEVK